MSDLYLKAASEAALIAALTDAGLVIDGQPQAVTIHDDGSVTDLYVIGMMFTTDGVEVTGFHANVRTGNEAVLTKLEKLSCSVSSPSFVFA